MKTRFEIKGNDKLAMLAGQLAQIVSVNGGWTTVETESKEVIKVRNGELSKPSNEQLLQFKVNKMEQDTENTTANVRVAAPAHLINEPRRGKIGNTEFDMQGYFVGEKDENGRRTIDCNDDVAAKLRTMELDSIYTRVSAIIGIPENELRAKYSHLNNGMQRMNLGNLIRGFGKKAEKEARQAEKEAEKQARQAEKEAKLAEKEAEKQARQAEREAAKRAKQAEKQAAKRAKQAEKQAA